MKQPTDVRPEGPGMLTGRGSDLALALEEVARCGASRLRDVLRSGAQAELVAALKTADFQRAPERAGDVQQDFDLLVIKSRAAHRDPKLSPFARPLRRVRRPGTR